jgi:hypothetical protein
VLEHARRNHLGGALVAEEEDRQAVVAAALGGQNLLQHLPLLLAGFRPIDGHEPARLVVEHLSETVGIGVAHACHDAETFLFEGLGKLAHANSGGLLAFIILIDDGNREGLKELHRNLPDGPSLEPLDAASAMI